MNSHTYMKCECSVCGKKCLPLYTKGSGIYQFSFCSEECLKHQLKIFNLKSGVHHTCYECDKEFEAYGVSDDKGFTYCSTYCAYRFNGIVQHVYEKEHYEQRVETLPENIDELQKMINSLTAEVESKEKEIKRIRSKVDLSTLEPLLDKLPAHIIDVESIMDEVEKNKEVLSILGLDELISKLQDAIKAMRSVEGEVFDKIMEEKRRRGE